MGKKEELTEIVGSQQVIVDTHSIEKLSRDESLVRPTSPAFIVKPRNTDEVQQIVKWANETLTPLVPISSGDPHFRGDSVPGVDGAVIVDLSDMKQILRVDRKNRVAMIEPGVTFGELCPELEKEGLRPNMPLLPRRRKSVVESVSEPGDASTPAGYISRRMMQVISSWYSKNLAVEVKKGLQKKVENGGWTKLAPLGYLNKYDGQKSWIEIDPKLGALVSQAFKEFATGKWTLEGWADHAFSLGWRSRRGNRIGKQAWSSIFHHRCYIGETWLKAGDMSIKGSHSPLVDEATFVQVQEVLRGHDKHKQRTQRHKYLLRGLVYSLEADSPCWSETHQRKGISYYRSRSRGNQSHVFYNTRVVEEQLPDIFRSITISEDVRQVMRHGLADWFDSETDTSEELKAAEARLAKLRTMEKNLQQLYLEEDISHHDFKEHRARIEAERSRLTNTVAAVKQRQNLVKADFEIALQLATELDYLYDRGNFDERRLLCETVLKRLYVEEGTVTKVELNSPFALIASRAKSSGAVTSGGAKMIFPH